MTRSRCYANRDVWVLQYGTTLAQVDAAMTAASLALREKFPADPLRNLERIYANADGSVVARYVADHFVHSESIVIEAPNRDEVLAWKSRISPPLEMFESIELVRFANSDNLVERSFGLRGLSSILRGFWMGAYKPIRDSLSDPRLEVRRLALLVTARVAWRELAVDLEAQAKVEPDAAFRGDLEMLAKN
jgi:hypothetical protein